MKCSCGKEFNDEFIYCPFCGKKKRRAITTSEVSVYDSLPVYNDEQLERFAQSISGKNAESIRDVLKGKAEKVNCYARKYSHSNNDFDDVFELREFKKSYIPKLGKDVFLTKEEAEEAYKRLCDEIQKRCGLNAEKAEEELSRNQRFDAQRTLQFLEAVSKANPLVYREMYSCYLHGFTFDDFQEALHTDIRVLMRMTFTEEEQMEIIDTLKDRLGGEGHG